jgi:two-component system, LytTR family, sensor kinase
MRKNRIYWSLQIGGWLLYASIQIVSSFIVSGTFSLRRALFLLTEALLCLVLTHLVRQIMNRRKWIFLPMTRLLPRVLGTVIAMSIVLYFIRVPVNVLFGRLFDPLAAFDPVTILGQSSFYAILFFLWTVFYFTFHYFNQYNKSLKYEASMIEIELKNLKSQLNPHFIFNALNSIRALVDENPGKSKEAINQLANILRNSLASDKKGMMRFDDELKIVKDYLGLESIRFEERLQTKFEIHPDSSQFMVPPMMIQTLVENGIKHGISKLTAGGIVHVKTEVADGRLCIRIRNSGHLIQPQKRSKTGLGLKNTMQRLKLIYGDDAAFRIVNENDTFVLTEIIIPQYKNNESINRR